MVQVIECSEDKVDPDIYRERLKLAKERLGQYGLLKDIFNNFEEYDTIEHYKESRNIIFQTCAPTLRPLPAFFGSTGSVWVEDHRYPHLLEILENTLGYFKSRLNSQVYERLIGRVKSVWFSDVIQQFLRY